MNATPKVLAYHSHLKSKKRSSEGDTAATETISRLLAHNDTALMFSCQYAMSSSRRRRPTGGASCVAVLMPMPYVVTLPKAICVR